MTNEQLDEIEKLADEWNRTGLTQYAEEVADNTLPLVKALREARAELGEALDELAFIKEEYGDGDPAEMTEDALLLKLKTITLHYNKAKTEIERLRDAMRQVHALAEKSRADWPRHTAWGALVDIHTITKGMVE